MPTPRRHAFLAGLACLRAAFRRPVFTRSLVSDRVEPWIESMATIHLPRDFKVFLKLLNAHHVEYLLIGGYEKKDEKIESAIRVDEYRYGVSCRDLPCGSGLAPMAGSQPRWQVGRDRSSQNLALRRAETPLENRQARGRLCRGLHRREPHPVIAHGKLYLRDQDNLFCYDLKAP
jgi:hypothetical protein